MYPQPQQDTMPNVNGVGSVPIMKWSADMDPALKCSIGGCQNVGNSVCFWANVGSCRKLDGGCGRRYCYQHRYEKVVPWHKSSLAVMCCTNCGAEFDEDIEKNGKYYRKMGCCCILGFIAISMLINLTI